MAGLRTCLAFLLTITLQSTSAGKVLLISMDGFRWDYLDKTSTPNFDRIVSAGVRVKQVTNAFATLTMPNHFTIVTGLYEEEHGIVSNKFYDVNYKQKYKYGRETKWYNSTEPIWITAEREGKKAGAYMWVGNQAKYDSVELTKMTAFRSGADHELAFNVVANWFSEDGLDFACLYINEPDSTGHRYGPDSDEIKAKIRELDELVGQLLDQFEEKQLTAEVNIIIASDHGMANIDEDHGIHLDQYLDFDNDTDFSYISTIGLILPKEGKLEEIYTSLKQAETDYNHKLTVYYKEDLPERFHYKDNERITPIVLVADAGWQLLKEASYKINMKAGHGYDNQVEDMKSFFVAQGPDFNCGYKQGNLSSTDIYPLMCQILGLETCHEHSGSLENSRDMVAPKGNSCLLNKAVPTAGASSLAMTLVGLALYMFS